jgi:hypothetical protein
MTDAPTQQQAEGAVEHPNSSLTVDLIMDHYRVCGELRTGIPRRLVDALNSADEPFVVIHDGRLDDPLISDDEPRSFKLIQVHLDTLLFGIPRSSGQVQPDPFEIIEKMPVQATIAMRGYEITGNVFLMPGMDPSASQILGSKHFIPMTDACVKSATNPDCVWREDVIVVNVARALLFAPH